MRDRMFLLLVPVLALTSPFLHAFASFSISPFSNGASCFLSGIVALALLLGLFAAVTRGPGRFKGALQSAALTATLVLTIDVAAGGATLLSFVDDKEAKLAVLLGGCALLCGLLYAMGDKAPMIAFSAASVFFFSTIGLHPSLLVPQASAAQPGEPAVIYVILDEMIAPEAIDRSIRGGEDVYRDIRALFAMHGFRLYGRSFSRHVLSSRSIPAALNFDFRDDQYGAASRYAERGSPSRFERLALFKIMSERGYSVHVHQSAHYDFCHANDVTECKTFPSFNPTSKYIDTGVQSRSSYLQRLRDLARVTDVVVRGNPDSYLVNYYSRGLTDYYDLDELEEPPAYYDVHGFPAWLQEIQANILRDGRGVFQFVHILAPHAPHLLNASCKPQSRWVNPYNLTQRLGLTRGALDAMRTQLTSWYFEQVQCLLSQLHVFMLALASDERFRQATIIFHGDHGSRISATEYTEGMTERDMIDNFPALYAIKAPGIVPGYDGRQTSIQRLTAEYLSGKALQELGPDNLTVVIDSEVEGRGSIRELPRF